MSLTKTLVLSFLMGTASIASAQGTPPAAGSAAAAPAAGAEKVEKKGKKAGLMDINAVSVDELKTLPGITDEIAQKIVAGRPYKGKDALLKQNIVDKDEYAKIRPLVVAHQPKKGDAAAAPAAAAGAAKAAAPAAPATPAAPAKPATPPAAATH